MEVETTRSCMICVPTPKRTRPKGDGRKATTLDLTMGWIGGADGARTERYREPAARGREVYVQRPWADARAPKVRAPRTW